MKFGNKKNLIIYFCLTALTFLSFCGKKEYFILEGKVLYGDEPVIQAEVGIVGAPPQKTDINGNFKFSLKKGKYLIYAKKDNLAFSDEIEITKDTYFNINITGAAKIWGGAYFRGFPKLVGVAFLPFFAPVKEDGKYTLYAPYGKHKIIFSELQDAGIVINSVDVVITGDTVLDEPPIQNPEKFGPIICPPDLFSWSKGQQASFRFITQNWFIFNFPCSITPEFKYDIPFNPKDLDSDSIPNEKDFDADGDGYDNDFEIKKGTDPFSGLSFPQITLRVKAISEDGQGGVIIYAGDDFLAMSSWSDGMAYMNLPAQKPRVLYAMKQGFFPEQVSITPTEESSQVQIVLSSGILITGKVFDSKGNPIPGAKVIVGEGSEEKITDSSGEFIAVVKRYPYGITLTVEKDGFFPFFDFLIIPYRENLNLKIFLCKEDEKDCIISYMLKSLNNDLRISIKYLDEFEKRFGRQPESNIIGIIIDVKSVIWGQIPSFGLDIVEYLHSKLSDIYERAQNAQWTTPEKIDFLITSGYFGYAEANFISAITRLIYGITKYILSHNLDFKEILKKLVQGQATPETIKIVPSTFSDKSLYFKEGVDVNEIVNSFKENLERARIELGKAYDNAPICPSENIICKNTESQKIYFAQVPFDYVKTLDFFDKVKSEFVEVSEIINFLPLPTFQLPITFIKINLSKFITKPLRDYLPETALQFTEQGIVPVFQIDFEKDDEDTEHFDVLKKDGIAGAIYAKFKDPSFSGSLIIEKCWALNFAQSEGIQNEIQAECGWKNPDLQDLSDVLAIIQKALKKRGINLSDLIRSFLVGNR
ncbi:MAG: hypothetical protein ACO2PO_03360 [Candidatus Calescibacterium sp.]